MKDMPAEAWEKGRSVEILRNNIFMDKQESFVAAMDSTGRFSVRVPLVNTSEIYIDIGRKGINTVVEPGETYFLLHDSPPAMCFSWEKMSGCKTNCRRILLCTWMVISGKGKGRSMNSGYRWRKSTGMR